MDSLTDFVAEIVEFVVGGVIFAASLALLLLALPGSPTVDHLPSWADHGSALFGLVAVAVAYAVGVVAEGLGRATFERLLVRVTIDKFDIADPDLAAAERERQRSRVKTLHPMLHGEVEGQLKRLRIERVVALSLPFAGLGLLLRSELMLGVVALLACPLMVWRVNDRFKRYCGSIKRGYDTTKDKALMDEFKELADG